MPLTMEDAFKQLEQMEKLKLNQSENDYDRLVPKEVHNNICYDEARRNIKSLEKETEEDLNNRIPNNAVKEILNEGDSEDIINQFDLGDITEYLETIKSLSFFEAASLLKRVDKEYIRWKSCYNMLNAIKNLKLDDSQNRQLMEVNALDQFEFSESMEDFEKVYDTNINKFEQIIKILKDITNQNNGNSTTSFLTNEIVALLEKKMDKLPTNVTNYEYTIRKVTTIVNAFKNRLDVTYLLNKYLTYLTTQKSKIKRFFKDDAKSIQQEKKTKVMNDLVRNFSTGIAYGYLNQLHKVFNDNSDAVYLFTNFLIKTMKSESNTGNDTWVKVLVMNLSDIEGKVFDLDDPDKYLEKINDSFYNITMNFLGQNKLTLNKHTITFGISPWNINN